MMVTYIKVGDIKVGDIKVGDIRNMTTLMRTLKVMLKPSAK